MNATGNDIALKSGVALDIFFLSLDVNLGACKVNLPGWTFSAGAYSLTLKYSGAAASGTRAISTPCNSRSAMCKAA